MTNNITLPRLPQESQRLTHQKYRADIDGLRAIAILSVVGFHAFPGWVNGGFIGVDVFFVISGFLISTIIFGSLERNSFSFVEFYSRRIKRIFPALLLILIASYAVGWFVLLADEYKQLGKHIAGGAGFASNFILWNESGYFDKVSGTKPLLHLWSLAIEEQYYILWPLILWLGWKKKFNLLVITLAIGIISFGLNVGLVGRRDVIAFYSPPTRFWELLLGSFLAYTTLYKCNILTNHRQKLKEWLPASFYDPHAKTQTLYNLQSALGAIAIAIGVLIISKEKQFPGLWAVLPTAGTALIISSGTQAWLNRIVLSNRVLVWFGLISFPLYLWHWSLLSYAQIIEGEMLRPETRIATVLISIVLAWLTYRLIEKPIRFGNHSKEKSVALLALMVVVGSVGYDCYAREGLEFRVKEFSKISQASVEWEYPGNLQSFTLNKYVYHFQSSGLANKTFFIGDSNIQQYYPRVDELIKNFPNATNSVIFSTLGCSPIPHVVGVNRTHCFDLLQKSLELIKSDKDITTVVLGAFWPNYLSDIAGFYYEEQGENYPMATGNAGYQKALASLSNYIQALKKNNVRIVLLLNSPFGAELDPKYMVKRSMMTFPEVLKIRDGGISVKKLDETYGVIKSDLARIALANQIEIIDPLLYMCNSDTCPSVSIDGEIIYRDFAHLAPSFVRKNATFIDSTVSN